METLTDWLRARAHVTPHRLAIMYEGRYVSYAELDRLTDRLAAGLVGRGVQPGDRVATRLVNSVEAIALIHAVARVRAVLVPLNTRLPEGEQAKQIALVEPVLVVDSGAYEQWAMARDSNGQWSQAPGIAQSIVFTSGSSGPPKGVVLSFDNHFWSANASAYRLGLDINDRWLSCLPLYHVGGLSIVFRSCLYGTAMVLQRGFDLDDFQRSLQEDRITLTSLVPTMLHRLLHSLPSNNVWPHSLRLLLLGGAAARPQLLAAAWEAGLPVATTYGLTEAASQVATALPADVQRKPGSVGKPLMFTQVKIADSSDQQKTAAIGEIGEVLVRGPQVMAQYYGNSDATATALQDGWLHSGDMGYLDPDGDLFIVQRRRDMIISGGENIYAAEVEAVLRGHPAVADACVVGLPDPEWGQRIAAAVQLHPGETLGQDDLLAYSSTRLAGYKQPAAQDMRFVTALPHTASGKIARQAVETLLARR